MVTRARVVLARCVAVDGFGCLFSHSVVPKPGKLGALEKLTRFNEREDSGCSCDWLSWVVSLSVLMFVIQS